MVLPTPPWSLARKIPRWWQKVSSAPAKSWFGRSRSAKARLVVSASTLAAATGPNSLKLVSGSGSAMKTAPSRPKASTSKGSATMVSSGRIWPPLHVPVGFRPQRMAMEEGGAVALSERHCRHLEPDDASGSKSVAVERGVRAGFGKRRHHIGERAERAAPDVQGTAANPSAAKPRRAASSSGKPASQREGEGAAARLDPLNALGRDWAGLSDAAHRQLVGLAVRSSSPRASSSSRTSRFGTLP